MIDPAHKETDEILKALEKRITAEYRQAEKEIQAKLDDYMRRFEKKDATWQKWVKQGKKTQEEYKKWRIGQIAIGKRWEEMKQTIAEDLSHVNLIARSIVDEHMPEVYALNHNYGTFEVETGSLIDTSYTLYSKESIEYLMKNNPQILPDPGKELNRRIYNGLDVRWNRQQLQSVMIQSILQGESIPAIADRLTEKVGERNRAAAIRNARTMTTGVEAAGRIDAYKRAEKMGINVRQQWIATLDGRTRHSHRMMDGETVDLGEKFSNGCRFPGDPQGRAEEVYNCRCTLIASLKGFEHDASDLSLRRNNKLKDMSYEEWKKAKPTYQDILHGENIGKTMKRSYTDVYRFGDIHPKE